MKVLIIDDEALVRKSLMRACTKAGFEVVEAFDGLDGREKWLKEKPNLVFLDVLMPGLSGPQLLKELQGQIEARVILMSAFSGEHNIETAQALGADLFIAKPFENVFAVVDQAKQLLHQKSDQTPFDSKPGPK